MAEVWTPQQGETVQVVDRDSNDFGKTGTVSTVRTLGDRNYGVTFGDNVLRYFKRDGLTWVSSPTMQPDPAPAEPPTIGPGHAWVLPRPVFNVHLKCDTDAETTTMLVRGYTADVLALAAELVKRG